MLLLARRADKGKCNVRAGAAPLFAPARARWLGAWLARI